MSADKIVPIPEGPARIKLGHSQDRLLGVNAGAKRGWRNTAESPLASFASRSLLAHGDPRYTSARREEAGEEYRRLWESAGRDGTTGQDSTQRLDRITSSTRVPITDQMGQAAARLVSIESFMSPRDRIIIQLVCGEKRWPSYAVRQIDPDYADSTVPRFREALDGLIEAMSAAERSGYKFSLAQVPEKK